MIIEPFFLTGSKFYITPVKQDYYTDRQETMTNYWRRSRSITTNYHIAMLYPLPEKKSLWQIFAANYRQTLLRVCSKHFLHGPSWSWSYGCWIYSYLCNQCISPLTLWGRIPFRRCVLDTTLCEKVTMTCCSSGGFLVVLRCPPLNKTWQSRYSWNIVESGVKHHNSNPFRELQIMQ